MSEEYEKGFRFGIDWAKKHTEFIVEYSMNGSEKIFTHVTSSMKLPEGFSHRSGAYNAGMGEGFITGRSSVRTDEKAIMEYCKKKGITYKKIE